MIREWIFSTQKINIQIEYLRYFFNSLADKKSLNHAYVLENVHILQILCISLVMVSQICSSGPSCSWSAHNNTWSHDTCRLVTSKSGPRAVCAIFPNFIFPSGNIRTTNVWQPQLTKHIHKATKLEEFHTCRQFLS